MLIILALFAASIFLPAALFYATKSRFLSSFFPKSLCGGKAPAKSAIFLNLAAFSAVFLISAVLIFSGRVYAAAPASTINSETGDLALAAAFLSAALVTGLGAIGTGIAVSQTAAAAIGAVSENENNFGKAMIFVAMAEGIAIYGLLIAFMILGRV